METNPDLEALSETSDWTLGATTKRRWAYACSKAMDEFLALAYADEKGLPVIAARFFNTVGPRQTGRYGMVIPTFVRQALAGDPIRDMTAHARAQAAEAASGETPTGDGAKAPLATQAR
jgi:UDP-glucose 4-epimerase